MGEKINIEIILKDKPKGTKLYSIVHGECSLVSLGNEVFQIKFCTSRFGLTQAGECTLIKFGNMFDGGECIVFPSKEMRDWHKFAWKRGDVLVSSDGGAEVIFDRWYDDTYTSFYCRHYLNSENKNKIVYYKDFLCTTERYSLENKDAAQTYIDTIEERLGSKLNMGTLEIEKVQPEFKDGDIVYAESNTKYPSAIFIYYAKYKAISYACLYLDSYACLYLDEQKTCNQKCYTYVGNMKLRYATEKEKQQLFDALAKKGKRWNPDTKSIEDLPKKYKFKPFDKVLARNNDAETWIATLFGFYDKRFEDYFCIGDAFKQCIPYNEETKHLLGTTDEWKGGE